MLEYLSVLNSFGNATCIAENLLNSPLCVVCGKKREEGSVLLSYSSTTTATITFTFKVFFSSSFLTFSSCLFPVLIHRTQHKIWDDDDEEDERGNVLAGYTKFPFMKALYVFFGACDRNVNGNVACKEYI